jgi:hypothetical protein
MTRDRDAAEGGDAKQAPARKGQQPGPEGHRPEPSMTDKPANPDAEKLLADAIDYLLADAEAWEKGSENAPHREYLMHSGKLRRDLAAGLEALLSRPLPTSLQPQEQPQEQPEQDMGVPFGPGSREPDQQAVPALRASIPDAGDET